MVAHGPGRRHGLRRGAHHRAHDPAGVRDHQDGAGRVAWSPACSSCAWPTGCSSTATARSIPTRRRSSSPTSRSRRRTTAAQFGIEPRVAMLSYSTGESGAGADVDKVREATRAGARARARTCRSRGRSSTTRRSTPDVAAHEAAGQRGGGAGDGVRLPRPQHGQQHLQGGAALGGRRRDRAGAAGPEQAGQRPVARRAGARHRQHGGDHRHPGAEPGRGAKVEPA